MQQKPTVKMILDSISPEGVRLTTIHAQYWRGIHSEVMTHREFSRNAGSSRARPSNTIIEQVCSIPHGPTEFGRNQKGMQSAGKHEQPIFIPEVLRTAWGAFKKQSDATLYTDPETYWSFIAWLNGHAASGYQLSNYHKQVTNRILEPYTYIDTLITTTNWNNFMHLRDHEDADPSIRSLAVEIKKCLDSSTPKLLKPGEWHLPYIYEIDYPYINYRISDDKKFSSEPTKEEFLSLAQKLSVARCARISYAPFNGDSSIEKELERYDLLVGSQPLHASPTEHQATPDTLSYRSVTGPNYRIGFTRAYDNPELHGNLNGWIQYRKTLEGEYVS